MHGAKKGLTTKLGVTRKRDSCQSLRAQILIVFVPISEVVRISRRVVEDGS